jgi:hypothetical protein
VAIVRLEARALDEKTGFGLWSRDVDPNVAIAGDRVQESAGQAAYNAGLTDLKSGSDGEVPSGTLGSSADDAPGVELRLRLDIAKTWQRWVAQPRLIFLPGLFSLLLAVPRQAHAGRGGSNAACSSRDLRREGDATVADRGDELMQIVDRAVVHVTLLPAPTNMAEGNDVSSRSIVGGDS